MDALNNLHTYKPAKLYEDSSKLPQIDKKITAAYTVEYVLLFLQGIYKHVFRFNRSP